MANCCWQYMSFVSTEEEDMEELKKIVLGKHPVYDLPLFDAYIDGDDYSESDDYYVMDVRGWTKWSISPLIDCDEYDKKGRRYVNLPFLLSNVLIHTAVELQCEEPALGYSAWMNVAVGGEYTTDTRVYYDWAFDPGDTSDRLFKLLCEDTGDTNIITADEKKLLDDMLKETKYPFSVLVGGYEWDYSSPDDIYKGKARPPIRKKMEILA